MPPDSFLQIANLSPEPTLLVNSEGFVLAVNRSAGPRLGLAADAWAGKRLQDVCTSPDLIAWLSRGADGPPLENAPVSFFDAAGQVRSALAQSVPLLESPGQFAITLVPQSDSAAPVDWLERPEIRDELLRDKEQLRVTLARIGDGVITTDPAGQVMFLNLVAESLTGWPLRDAAGTAVDEVVQLIDELTDERTITPVLRVAQEGVVQPLEASLKLVSRTGTSTPIDGTASPLRDREGRVTGVVLILRDLSTRKTAEAEVRMNRRLLQNVLDSTPAYIFLKNREGRLLLVNRQFTELAGRPASEIIGRLDSEVLSGDFEAIHANDRQVLESGQVLRFEERLLLPEGHRSFLSIKAPIDGIGEAEPILIGISTDVTERVRAEEEVSRLLLREREQSARLTELSTASLRIHSALSLESVLRTATAEAQRVIGSHQASCSMVADENWSQAISTQRFSDKYRDWRSREAPPECEGLVDRVCRTNRVIRLTAAEVEEHPDAASLRAETDRRPGAIGWLAAPFVGRDGRNLGLIALSDKIVGEFTEDDEATLAQLASVTSVAIENSRLYQELRSADRRKDEFLAMLAHELRNPLAPIRNALVLLGMDGLDAETAGQAREIMNRQVDHLVRLVDDLLDVSRIMRGKIELKKEPVEAKAIVSRAVETVQPLIQSQGQELTLSLPPEPVWVHADLVRMAQVIANLLNNSAKYTPQGGHIWLTVERAAGGVRFRVRDNGVGIDRELLPRVFDLFTQASRSIARSQGGLGIGLTLVRNLVEMHDGTVSATSAGPGQGSEFIVSLPALEQSPPPPVDEWKPQPTRELKVLVVEDMVGSARILSAMLQKFWNHSVMMVHDGLDALHAAKSFHPDVVLLDIGLPGISGFDVARRLRQEPETRETLLVALTGYGTAEDRQKSEDAGFDEHLVKPASVHSLQKLFAHPRLAE